METLYKQTKKPACTVGWVARLVSQLAFPVEKMGEIPMGQQSSKKGNYFICSPDYQDCRMPLPRSQTSQPPSSCCWWGDMLWRMWWRLSPPFPPSLYTSRTPPSTSFRGTQPRQNHHGLANRRSVSETFNLGSFRGKIEIRAQI